MDGSQIESTTEPLAPAQTGRFKFFSRRRPVQSPNEALQPEAAPPPPPIPSGRPASKRHPTLSAMSGFLSFLLVALIGIGSLFLAGQSQISQPGPLSSEKVVYIAPRTDVLEIIDQLEQEGVIDSPTLFKLALWGQGKWANVRFGEYAFKANASIKDVIDNLVSGKQVLHSITIPEGLTTEQIVQRLRDEELLAGVVNELPKEGVLLPETYRFARDMSRNDLLRKMQDDQNKQVDQIWAHRAPDLPLKSKYELITLASIVEKETAKADERPRVAGVYMNRLQKRMRLQSDPTIVYGLVGGKGTLGRGILKTEIEQATPYNTYVIEGLPPGPIANPGRAALEAAANPSRTKELYFVADGTGGHAFAETLEQHQKNVVRWRQIEKEMKDKTNSSSPVDRLPATDLPGLTPAGAAPTTAPAVAPATAPAPARNQRGDLEQPASIFGSLPGLTLTNAAEGDLMIGTIGASPLQRLDQAPVAGLLSDVKLLKFSNLKSLPALKAKPNAGANQMAAGKGSDKTSSGNFAITPGIDQNSFELAAKSKLPRQSLDGPVDDPQMETVATSPVPLAAARQPDQQAAEPRNNDPKSRLSSYAQTSDKEKVTRIYDASEGTPLDPLKNKSWDLNSGKVVPSAITPPAR